MSDGTKIEWTDATWNPVTGCSVVSAGCKHCYAMKLAGTRLRNHPSRAGLTIDTKAGPVWNGEVRFNTQWLLQPRAWSRPRRIFVCAHGDLFHESVRDDWIAAVFGVMAESPQHQFQVLTKRPDRMRHWFEHPNNIDLHRVSWMHETIKHALGYDYPGRPAVNESRWPLPNVWLGVSVENQEAANLRIPSLLDTPAAVRWISAEPLLGPVDLSMVTFGYNADGYDWLKMLDWVVAGGESGEGARPMHPDWARLLRDQCETAGVAFLFKQWGAWAPVTHVDERGNQLIKFASGKGETLLGTPGQPGTYQNMALVGKKVAGRHLDGHLHDGYPVIP
jgi:protein gp37